MKVVVTGASGFIGMPVIKMLSNSGFKVLAISRSVHMLFGHENITFLKADLSNPNSYKKEIELFSPRIFIHLAWQDIPDFSLEKSQKNLEQSLDIVSFIASLGCCQKMIFSGSCLEYDVFDGKCKETSDENEASSHFSNAKNTLRKQTEKICLDKSINFIWFRLFYVYGPGQRHEAIIPSILMSLKDGILPKINFPYNANDYIFIDDVVRAFILAAKNTFPSAIYNLGSGSSSSVLEICRISEKIVLGTSVLSDNLERNENPSESDLNFWACVKSTKKFLNFQSEIKLSDGIGRTWNYLNSND